MIKKKKREITNFESLILVKLEENFCARDIRTKYFESAKILEVYAPLQIVIDFNNRVEIKITKTHNTFSPMYLGITSKELADPKCDPEKMYDTILAGINFFIERFQQIDKYIKNVNNSVKKYVYLLMAEEEYNPFMAIQHRQKCPEFTLEIQDNIQHVERYNAEYAVDITDIINQIAPNYIEDINQYGINIRISQILDYLRKKHKVPRKKIAPDHIKELIKDSPPWIEKVLRQSRSWGTSEEDVLEEQLEYWLVTQTRNRPFTKLEDKND